MHWPLYEKSVLSRYAIALAIAAVAAACQWLLFAFTQGRSPFVFFVASIIFATWLGGRGPGIAVLMVGLLNAHLQMEPVGSLVRITSVADRITLSVYVILGVVLVFVGNRLRSAAKREYNDLHELHELSVAVAASANLKEQLDLILQTLARIHGTDRGLVALFDARTDAARLISNLGFSPAALARMQEMPAAERATGLACLERRRVVVEDVTVDPAFCASREFARQEGIRAAHSTPLFSRSGKLLGAIAVYFPAPCRPTPREMSLADICATKAAVAIERAAAEELAQAGEQRFRTVLESSAVPFSILEPIRAGSQITDFRFRYVNAAAACTLRRTQQQLIGQPVGTVLPRTWEEPGLLQRYAACVETNIPIELDVRSEAKGIIGWFHIVASPLEGRLAIWFADVTERRQQERALQEGARKKDEFLATLAHELRNPLAPIRQAASITQSDRANESQKRWAYSVIQRQVQHMSLLLDDLLDVSRITRGTLTLRKQPVQLRDVLSAATETVRPLIDSRHHALNVEIPETLELSADPLRLSQILSNLLTNAAKYTEPGGKIRLCAESIDRTLAITVEDTGIGIREEDIPRVFDMFTQLGASGEHAQGLGIGLALTRGLVEMHGGTIEARSGGPGKGSIFVVRMPMGDAAVAPSSGRSEAGETKVVVSRRILIADDNRDAAESLAILLRFEGHDVAVAHDGEAALQAFEAHSPDAALLDIGMPSPNGYEVARQIRARPDGTRVLLVALTGWGQEKDRQLSREAGFDHHLTKPIEPNEVVRLLQPTARMKAACGGAQNRDGDKSNFVAMIT